MTRPVPVWVKAAIAAYDSSLRLRWSDLAEQFVLERKVENSDHERNGRLMAILAKRVGRLKRHEQKLIEELRDKAADTAVQGFIRKVLPQVLHGRMDAGVRLEALRDGYTFCKWVPQPTANEPWADRLKCILYTLGVTDIWAAGGADAYYQQDLEDERLEEVRRQAALRANMRSGAGEVYDDIARGDGRRIVVNRSGQLQKQAAGA